MTTLTTSYKQVPVTSDIENQKSKDLSYLTNKFTSWKVSLPTTLSWSNLSYEADILTDPMNPFSAKVHKKILDNVEGEVRSSEFLAILGPSGCGKTSLLDILANRSSGNVTGSVLVNGAKMAKTFYPAYVEQEDSLLSAFTAKETLLYSAALNLDYKIGYNGRLEKVDNLLKESGLESCADTIVGNVLFKGLSGGQKRRLSLDEPTTGLDSASASEIVQLLLNLCMTKGLSIACTIHQPSSSLWVLFEKVLLLSSGKQIYFGEGKEAVKYFSKIGFTCPKFSNPADYFLGLINTDFASHTDISQLNQLYQQHLSLAIEINESQKSIVKSFINPNPSIWHFFVLTHRFFINSIRNPGIIGIRLSMYIMLSIAIAGVFLVNGHHTTDKDIQGRMGIIDFILCFYIFQSVTVVPFYMWDSATYTRERLKGEYQPGPFVVANFLANAPGLFLIAFCSSVILVPMMALLNLGYFILILFLALLCAEGFVVFIAELSPHYIIGIALAAGAYGFFMLCNGFFQLKPDIPPWFIWVFYMGFHTYAYRAAIVNEFGSRGVLKEATNPQWKTGHDVLVYMGFNNVQKGDDCWTLVGYTAVCYIVYYLILKFIKKGKR